MIKKDYKPIDWTGYEEKRSSRINGIVLDMTIREIEESMSKSDHSFSFCNNNVVLSNKG